MADPMFTEAKTVRLPRRVAAFFLLSLGGGIGCMIVGLVSGDLVESVKIWVPFSLGVVAALVGYKDR